MVSLQSPLSEYATARQYLPHLLALQGDITAIAQYPFVVTEDRVCSPKLPAQIKSAVILNVIFALVKRYFVQLIFLFDRAKIKNKEWREAFLGLIGKST
jgi:hypothetical protein